MKLRREVRLFAEAMEERLRANEHKGGWQNESCAWLTDRLQEEIDELRHAFPEDTLHEAADVANFAMMIADVCGALARRKGGGEG